MSPRERYDAFDRYQQRHGWLGFPLAVRQKYSDDSGGYLGATITYYGFFSVFPLLLVFVTILGFVLQDEPDLKRRIVNTTLGQLPIVGHAQIHSLSGNTLALVVGSLLALWAGMSVFVASEYAMNQLWGIPYRRRPDFFRQRARALLLMVVLGGGMLVATALGGLASFGASLGVAWKVGSILLSGVLDFALFWIGFRVLTHGVGWRYHLGGAAFAAVGWVGLQLLGGYYVGHVLKNASETYGTFATVIGLLSWIYLAVHVMLLGVEGNVVASRRLWPRSFSLIFQEPLTDADRRALEQRTRVEARRDDQEVEVGFD
jgi:membrane protein